jgi:rRNA pseudouridine-1189 N-methylase Emg1 (Nep1/Mra1 family)
MLPMQILPCKRFYKVDIRAFTEDEKTSTWSLISKIWHVATIKMSSSPYVKCRIETFCRVPDDNTMQQSEKSLWSTLAMINDDITLLIDDNGQPMEIINYTELQKKAHAAFAFIRERFDGDLIEKLLADAETVYNDASLLLFELNTYKQFGLLTPCLYNNDLNIITRDKIVYLQDATCKADVEERFTRKDAEDMLHFSMKGRVKNQKEILTKIDTYVGEFVIEAETCSIHKASVEIAYSMPDYKKIRTYVLQELSASDMEYL